MSEQHLLNHLSQIDFWQNLKDQQCSRLDWRDNLAIRMIIERHRGKDAALINELVLDEIHNAECLDACLRDPSDPQPEVAPSIESVIECANELTALYQKVDEVSG